MHHIAHRRYIDEGQMKDRIEILYIHFVSTLTMMRLIVTFSWFNLLEIHRSWLEMWGLLSIMKKNLNHLFKNFLLFHSYSHSFVQLPLHMLNHLALPSSFRFQVFFFLCFSLDKFLLTFFKVPDHLFCHVCSAIKPAEWVFKSNAVFCIFHLIF